MTSADRPPTAIEQIAPVIEEIRHELAALRVLATEMRDTDERPDERPSPPAV